MIEEPLTPSELIYLYVDGEADSIQQTTLFAALATDPELQQEFNEALAMRKAFEHERVSTQPPAYLTTKVFEDAGLITGTTVGAGIATIIWLWLRKASIPLGASILGAIAMYLGLNFTQKDASDLAQQQNIAPQTIIQKVEPILQTTLAEGTPTRTQNTPPVRKIVYVEKIRPIVDDNNNVVKEVNVENQSEIQEPVNYGSEEHNIGASRTFGDNIQSSRYNAQMVVAPKSSFITPSFKGIQTLGMNGVGYINFNGRSDNQSDAMILNQSNYSMYYATQLSDNLSLGVEGGSITISNTQYYRGGIYGMYRFEDAIVFGGQPYAQAILGTTLSNGTNPYVNLNLGFSFPLWYTIRLNTGFETNLLFLSDKTHGTLGLTSGLSYSF